MRGRLTASRPLAVVMAAAMGVSSCAHVGEGEQPLALTERVIREVCIPYVVDGIDPDEVGRRLGNWWSRELPDPFSPQAGPTFRRGGATVQVVNGRRQRSPDGTPTTRPMRNCQLWIGRQDEAALVATVRAAAASHPDVVMAAPGHADGFLRIVACIPSGADKVAVVRASIYPPSTRRSGAGVYETGASPAVCVG